MSALNPAAQAEVAYVRRRLTELELAPPARENEGKLQALVDILLRVIDGLEAPPKSERLAAQHDEQLLNLARAARMEIHAARGSLRRLDGFEQALTRMLWPEEESR